MTLGHGTTNRLFLQNPHTKNVCSITYMIKKKTNKDSNQVYSSTVCPQPAIETNSISKLFHFTELTENKSDIISIFFSENEEES